MSGIIRVNKSRDYSLLNNTSLRDSRMSFGARGILAYLLTKPDNWQVRSDDLIAQSPAGRDAILTMLKELEACGYLKRERKRSRRGRWEWQTEVFEVPQITGENFDSDSDNCASEKASKVVPSPKPDFPTQEKPTRVEPARVKPTRDQPAQDKPTRVQPDGEKPTVKEILSEEALSKEIHIDKDEKGLCEGECVRVETADQGSISPQEQIVEPAHIPAQDLGSNDSNWHLLPNPSESLELRVLAGVCNLNPKYPHPRDVKCWPRAVATIRDSMPSASPEEIAAAIRRFKEKWKDGGKRSTLYLSQVVDHWYRLMTDDLSGKQEADVPADPHLEMKRRAMAAAYNRPATNGNHHL